MDEARVTPPCRQRCRMGRKMRASDDVGFAEKNVTNVQKALTLGVSRSDGLVGVNLDAETASAWATSVAKWVVVSVPVR